MGQSDPVTHPVNISTTIMNSVKCVAAALMLASSVVNGAELGEMTDMGLLKRILMELLPSHMELLLRVMELQPHLMELLLRLVLTSPPSSSLSLPSLASSSSSPLMSPSPASEGRERLLMIPKFLSMLLRE